MNFIEKMGLMMLIIGATSLFREDIPMIFKGLTSIILLFSGMFLFLIGDKNEK